MTASVLAATASRAAAADRPQIAVLNVVIQGGLTLVSAAVQGNIHSRGDVVRAFTTGSASGAGMYEAKVLISNGHNTAGWLVANAAGSLSENAIAGRHPLAQFGYSIGPARIRFSVPRFDPHSDAHAHLDVSAYEILTLLVAVSENDRPAFRSGMIVFRRDSLYDSEFGDDVPVGALGATAGIFPGVFYPSEMVWNHETIHAVQALQGDVVEPSFKFLSREPAPPGSRKPLLRFESVKVGVVNMANGLLFEHQQYHERWEEIEAYRLTANRPPPGGAVSDEP